MNTIKKIIIGIGIISITQILPCLTTADFSFTDEFPYEGIEIHDGTVDTDFNEILNPNTQEGTNGVQGLLQLFMPNNDMYVEGNGQPSFIFYLKTVVNLLLSFVSFIALIFVIYAFYMIFFKKDEAGITTAKQIIKGVVIALFIIGFSRIVVSMLYRFENENTENVGYHSNQETVTSLA